MFGDTYCNVALRLDLDVVRSECIFEARGRNSNKVKVDLLINKERRLPCVSLHFPDAVLNIVHDHRHLGHITNAAGSENRNVMKNISKGMDEFRHIRKNELSSDTLEMPHEKVYADSFVLSNIFHECGVWSKLSRSGVET